MHIIKKMYQLDLLSSYIIVTIRESVVKVDVYTSLLCGTYLRPTVQGRKLLLSFFNSNGESSNNGESSSNDESSSNVF